MPKDQMILVNGVGKMRRDQVEKEIAEVKREIEKYETEGDEGKANRLHKHLRPYLDALRYHGRSWI